MFSEHKLEQFAKKIIKLEDRPQMSAQALKEYFDSSAEELRLKFNALIDALDTFGAASFEAVEYNAADGKLTFTFGNGSAQMIDLPLELLIESGHYDADAQSIVLTLANSDVITIPVSDLIDEYEADEKTLHMAASETSRVFSVKDGVFASEAPADNKPYMRKDGAWTPYALPEADEKTITTDTDGKYAVKDGVFTPEAPADGILYGRKDGKWEQVIDSLPKITLAEADDVIEGIYRVRDGDNVGLLCASTDIFVYAFSGEENDPVDTVDIEGEQTVIWGDSRILKRTRSDYIMDISDVVQNEDGSYSLKPGYVFYDEWSAWESIIPSLTDYATKAYVDTQADAAADAVTPNAFELIASGETTEEVNSIIISKDNDGKAFELCDMINIYIECPKSTNTANTALTFNFGNYILHQTITTAVNTTAKRYITFRSIYTGGKWDTQSCAAETGAAQIYGSPANNVILHKEPSVTNIKLYIYNTEYKLPVGFKYEIYGRRVKNANS